MGVAIDGIRPLVRMLSSAFFLARTTWTLSLAENNEVVSVLRELSSKFDSLRQDVDRLKERSVVDDTERCHRSRSPSTCSLSRSRQERRDPSPSRSRSRSGRRERQRPRRRQESADSENWGHRMERLSEEEDRLGPSLPSWTQTKSQTWWRSLRPPRSSLPSGAPWA